MHTAMSAAFIVLVFSAIVCSCTAVCPSGSDWRQSASDSNKCFLVVTTRKIWFEAEMYCQSLAPNSYLTSISSAYEMFSINAIVFDTLNISHCDQMWIGAADFGENGQFVWSDDRPFQYTKWHPGQPDPDSQCVTSAARTTGKWRTADCCGTENCFICETYDGSASSTTAISTNTTPRITITNWLTTRQTSASHTGANPSGPCDNLDIMFLIDESQSMFLQSGWDNTKTFVINVVNTFKDKPTARFAWVAFNSVIWSTTTFKNASDFKNTVNDANYNTGATNFELGFQGAYDALVAGGSSLANNRRPALIFVSDGQPNPGDGTASVSYIAKKIRCDLGSMIIGLGISEDASGAQSIRDSIGVGDVTPNCGGTAYNDIPGYDNLSRYGLATVFLNINC